MAKKLTLTSEWWTAPAEADNGNLIMVTGRENIGHVKETGVFTYRVEVTWPYDDPDPKGMPGYETSCLMDQVNEALQATFDSDPVAVNTGIYTGDGSRNWVFYTRSLHIFQRKLNEVLAPFPQLPLSFEAYDDPDWEEYAEMEQARVDMGE